MHVLIDGEDRVGTVLLAHGAGAGMEHVSMQNFAQMLVRCGLRVVRFEFPYMQQRRATGVKRPPDRMPVLEQCFLDLALTYQQDSSRLILAGKSMGGRVASRIAPLVEPSAVLVFGFPFHPQGKSDKLRLESLQNVAAAVHIYQGTRDKLGDFEEVSGYTLDSAVCVNWLEDGDHDLKPRVRSGFTYEAHLASVERSINGWLQGG
ncbi:MAG: alpha/beta family hydrolase [Pseudomonadales bacterium]